MDNNTGSGGEAAQHGENHEPEGRSRGRPSTPVTQTEAAEIITAAILVGHNAGMDIRIGTMEGAAFVQFAGYTWVNGKLVIDKR